MHKKFGRKVERYAPLCRLGHRSEDNIKLHLIEAWCFGLVTHIIVARNGELL